MVLINYIKYFFIILIYTLCIYLFGIYMRLNEFVELFSCFACKEMDQLESVYDYIIVGCGSAGSTVALRLSEDKNVKVLVLEAGGSGSRLLDIPAITPLLQQSSIDWKYQTVPQTNACLALNNRQSNWPMGCILGGTGRLNNMIYLRGHPNDYKSWYENVPDFNYEEDILAYFKKAENYKTSENNKYHLSKGHLFINELPFVSQLSNAFLKAIESLGYEIKNLNDEKQFGFMQPQANIHFGSRWTTSHYLTKLNRPNLIIQTNTLVHKVLLKDNYEAYAIKYSYLGSNLFVKASKGIILSAGVIGTPKLLMLSGIGIKEHLINVGIKSKINLPVGNNLQDHISTGLDLIILNTTLNVNIGNIVNPYGAYNYFYKGTGPWTTIGCEVIGLIDTENDTYCLPSLIKQKMTYLIKKKRKKKDDDTNILDKYLPEIEIITKNDIKERCYFDSKRVPDLQFMVIPLGVSSDFGKHLRNVIGLNDKIWNDYFSYLKHKTAITILPILLHPKSKGYVRLKNKYIYSKPLIDPQYLSYYEDIEVLIKGIEIIKNIISTESMQKLGATLNDKKIPGCDMFKFNTKSYWECYVQHLTLTVYHPVGTCKMGSQNDRTSVVDYNFRIYGTNKLYVADASVFPSLPSGNINAAVVMMAEKAAATIKYHNYLNRNVCYKKEVLLPKKIC